MGIGGSEIFLIFIVILLLFGADKIPEFAKILAKGMKEFKKASDEIKREINNADIVKDVNKMGADIKQDLTNSEISKDMKEINDNLKLK
jgi:sec-independent protein translocase protein TatA